MQIPTFHDWSGRDETKVIVCLVDLVIVYLLVLLFHLFHALLQIQRVSRLLLYLVREPGMAQALRGCHSFLRVCLKDAFKEVLPFFGNLLLLLLWELNLTSLVLSE